MGEAARRRAATRDTDGGGAAAIDRDKLAQALRLTLASVSQDCGTHASDCLLYASVGAEVLRRLGLSAQLRTGDAEWRVGPGDGDVIHNAASLGGPTFGPSSAQSMVFHAWVRIEARGTTPAQLVDFTTWQLRDKGRRLDLADGGHTRVEFCPDYLWVPEVRARALSLRQVGASYDVGVYHYAELPPPAGLKRHSAEAVATLAEVVMYCYAELLACDAPAASLV
ncbi:hypothetical protein LPN04_31185 [Rugamonas sp. A1-17]|nr:hypothetical protein [Rugamonas sp. A1-17]